MYTMFRIRSFPCTICSMGIWITTYPYVLKFPVIGAMTDSMSLSNMPKNLPVIYERFPATVGSKPSMAVPIWEAGTVSRNDAAFLVDDPGLCL